MGKDRLLRDMLIHFSYESKLAGLFNDITFTHKGFTYNGADSIQKNAFVFDYLPLNITNEIDPKSGMIKAKKIPSPRKKKVEESLNSEKEEEEAYPHWNLCSYVEETAQDYSEVLADYQAYFLNLRKFGKLVDADLQRRPMFRFLCFILNERHQNRVILSHFGSRFDNLIVQEYLLLMGFRPKTLTQGQGVLQLTIPPWNIVFLDSFRYFPQKLATLPRRFQLDDAKGWFSHIFNKPHNWNVI